MNSLHNVIEAALNGDIRAPMPGLESLDRWRKNSAVVLESFIQCAGDAVCFYAGNDLGAFEHDPALCRMPYETMWIECGDASQPGRVGTLMICDDNSDPANATITQIQFFQANGKWHLAALGTGSPANLGGWHIHHDRLENRASFEELLSDAALFSLRFLCALNCRNVQSLETPPPQQLQAARARRGKLPLFSTWTLHIGPESAFDKGQPQGTHASPRVHLRRGHFRKLQCGRAIWVQPCVVGSKEAGMVHKDYAWTGGTAA